MCNPYPFLTAAIEGKKYTLESRQLGEDVQRVGDYKAKASPDGHTRSYEYSLIYEFLFPDCKTRRCGAMSEEE